MSQIDLAQALDMSQTQVSRYELSQNNPTSDVIISLAQVLGVRAEWLLGLTDSMIAPVETEGALSGLEREAIEALRHTDPAKREAVVAILRQIAALTS